MRDLNIDEMLMVAGMGGYSANSTLHGTPVEPISLPAPNSPIRIPKPIEPIVRPSFN